MNIGIVELTSESEMLAAWPVMVELRDHLSFDEYRRRLQVMAPDGYRVFVVKADGSIVALAGIAIRTNLYYGRYLYGYDLVTSSAHRSKGYGKELLAHLELLAKGERCDTIALTSGVQRADAHRFYQREGYSMASYAFVKSL